MRGPPKSIIFLTAILLSLLISTATIYHRDAIRAVIHRPAPDIQEPKKEEVKPEEKKKPEKPVHPPWVYKPEPTGKPDLPLIKDNFPSADSGLLPIPSWNKPPAKHVPDATPLLIGFTRNWRVLQQAVVSYITAGWPPEDIYVVENTGVMDNNKKGKLSLQNPFFLNYTRLEMLGVNVIRTPTLLNFAQLQNFYINFAVERDLKAYYWGHMDVIVLSDEARNETVYDTAVEKYRQYVGREKDWGAVWFAYDRLVLVNLEAYLRTGGWDTFIGFYGTDCDFHERIMMNGYKFKPHEDKGFIFDVGSSVDDLKVFYREGATKHDQGYQDLFHEAERIQNAKNSHEGGRNFWQGRQEGGQDEPFYRDPAGFEAAIQLAIAQGRATYAEKWGHRDCDLRDSGLKLSDAWKVEKDFRR